MTFEESWELALAQLYLDQDLVYRIDVHCYA